MKRVFVVKVEDCRPVDFTSGKRLAATEADTVECQCCGRQIAIVHVLNTGQGVGSECAAWAERPDSILYCRPRFSKRQRSFYRALGIEESLLTL